MTDINLLPSKRRKPYALEKIWTFFYRINIFFLVIFFITSSVFVFLIIYNQRTIDSISSRESKLKSDLNSASFKEVETGYYFVKDRAKKASEVLENRGTLDNLDEIDTILKKLSYYKLSKAECEKKSLSFEVFLSNYGDLSDIFSVIRENGNYGEIVLENLSFSRSQGGYLVGFTIKK